MGVLDVALTIVVLVGVAVFILVFERRRAQEIEDELDDKFRLTKSAPRNRK